MVVATTRSSAPQLLRPVLECLTIVALQDHGQIASTLEQGVDDARRTLESFADAGVDYQEVVDVLEREGVQKFADSFKELFERVSEKREQFAAAQAR